jgi:sigma-B regulation protein RsbU (phosphoserine phosphatase)
MFGCRVRLWRAGRGRLRPVLGSEQADPPQARIDDRGFVEPTDPSRPLVRIPGLNGYWCELVAARSAQADAAERLVPLIAQLLDSERETLALAKQLASRYEEIELLYTIAEVLGQTTRVDHAAEPILRAVSTVVGARRASLYLHDESAKLLRPIASIGKGVAELPPVAIDDRDSVAAQAYRSGEPVTHDPRHAARRPIGPFDERRGYLGSAYLSVPVTFRGKAAQAHPVGVLNLTDRVGADAFSGGEQRLVRAVAAQIGAALEHARLVERDVVRQRINRELELAHGLQLKLLTSPEVLGAGVDVAARCLPARSVGGDFYHFVRLPGGRIGVMLGDVSSSGFAAALIMALVLSAAGIHAAEVASPDGTLRRLLDSVEQDLRETEMHLSLFYGVIDARAGVLRYANAGHPYAFRLGRGNRVERLHAISPPLGLASRDAISAAETHWNATEDRLLLFSDGIVEARDDSGAQFGEERVLAIARRHERRTSAELVEGILAATSTFEAVARDDRAVLALRV